MRHGTYSIVALDPDDRRARRGGAVALVLASARCARGRGRGSAPWPRSRWSSPPTGRTRSTGSRTASRRQQALGELLAADPLAAVRQVAVIDARGSSPSTRAPTASRTPATSTGEHHSCQANMMARDTVPAAMSAAFSGRPGLLQERLLAALEAAEAEGGDVRGRQSAAMVVVPARGRAVAADGRPARGGPRRRRSRSSAGSSRCSAPTTSRARATSCSPRAAPTRPVRSTRRRRSSPRLGRAALLGRPRPRPGGRPGRRRGGGPESRRGQPGLAGPPRPALTGIRSGGRSGPSRRSSR